MKVLVVGAGVVGCAVAYELAARGASVGLLDMRDVGLGATRASAGVLCPYIEGHAAPLLRLGSRSLGLYDQFIARVEHEARKPIEYRRTGTLEVALTSDDAERLKQVADTHVRSGVEHRFLDARAARALEPALTEHVKGALLVPIHGYLAVPGLVDALTTAAVGRGASIARGETAKRVAGAGSGVRVETDARSYDADAVVIAAGSWSGTIEITRSRVPVRPVRGQLVHLASPKPVVSRVIWGANCYLVPWEDGSLLIGATVEDVGFDEGATVAGVRGLLDHACELLPPAGQATFREVRVGLRPATADELPIIGRSSHVRGVYYATGHYRNGVLLAPLTAAALADLILDGKEAPELAITSPERVGL